MNEQPTTPLTPDPLQTNLLHAAEADRVAERLQKNLEAAKVAVQRLEVELGNARHAVLQIEQQQEAVNASASGFRRAAYVIGEDRKLPKDAMEAAERAAAEKAALEEAAAAVAAAPQPSEQRTCMCGQTISLGAQGGAPVHIATGFTACDPDRPDGPQAQPVPLDNPLGQQQNGQYAAEGAVR